MLVKYNIIFLKKYFITYRTKIFNFMVIDTDENSSVVAEEFACEAETWIHHVAPVGVVAAVGFGVGTAFLSGLLLVILDWVIEFVVVHEVVAGVVWRVNVDQLDLAMVGALEQFQDFEVVAFDVEVLGGVPVDAFVLLRAQGRGGGSLGLADGVALARPGERVAFLTFVHAVSKDLAQLVEVDLPVPP